MATSMARPTVNAEWLRFFRKARGKIRSKESLSRAKAYDMSSRRAYPRWWRVASQSPTTDGHGYVRKCRLSHGESGPGGDGRALGDDNDGDNNGDSDVTSQTATLCRSYDLSAQTIRRCAELEASLSAQFDEESSGTYALFYPALPITRQERVRVPRDSASNATSTLIFVRDSATDGHATDGHATDGHATGGHAIGGHATDGHLKLNSVLPERRRSPESNKKKSSKDRKGGAFKSTELSRRWKKIVWPSVFDGSSTADCLFVRSALIRKDLLFTFDPCMSEAGTARVIPRSGVVTCIQDVQQFILLEKQEEQHEKQEQEVQQELLEEQEEQDEEELWVLKPSDASNAYGVHFFRSGEATRAAEAVLGSNSDDNEADHVFVVQRYIRPLLLNTLKRRKFHIRTLMVCRGGPLKRLDIFKYQESRVLVASEEWTPRDLSNKWIHITNKSVNCEKASYNADEQNRSLETVFGDERAVDLHTAMADIMVRVMQSIHSRAKKSQFMPLDGCYELFGLDFCVDSSNKVWLLEANPEPSIALFPGSTRQSILGANPHEALPVGWEQLWSSSLFDAVRRLKRKG